MSQSLRTLRSLFVANSEKELEGSILQASLLAQLLGGEFVVLGMFPEEGSALPEVVARGKKLCKESGLHHRQTMIKDGDWLSILANIVVQGRFDLVIVAPKEGHMINKMVCRLQVPVLVVRHGAPKTILAAVDLQDNQLAIVSRASQMSRHLSAPLVMVHNTTPKLWHESEDVAMNRERLQSLGRGTPPGTKIMLLHERDAVSALLSCEARIPATMIIVGARNLMENQSSSFHTAARIVEQSSGDVLVTPLSS